MEKKLEGQSCYLRRDLSRVSSQITTHLVEEMLRMVWRGNNYQRKKEGFVVVIMKSK